MFNIVSLTDKLWLSFPLKSGGDVTLKHTSSHSYISDFHSPACFTPTLGCRISILNSPVMHAKSFQSCLILCDPMDCSLPCSSLYGIFQAGTLESVAISSSRGSSRPRDRIEPTSPALAGGFSTTGLPGKPSGFQQIQLYHNFLQNTY